jgi:hypothetical protein
MADEDAHLVVGLAARSLVAAALAGQDWDQAVQAENLAGAGVAAGLDLAVAADVFGLGLVAGALAASAVCMRGRSISECIH